MPSRDVQSFCSRLEKLPRMVKNLGTRFSEVLVNVNLFEFMWILKIFEWPHKSHFHSWISQAHNNVSGLVVEWAWLWTFINSMWSNDLYSGSISDINLVSIVSTSPSGSWIPDIRNGIRLLLPYYSRLSKSFLSWRWLFQDC